MFPLDQTTKLQADTSKSNGTESNAIKLVANGNPLPGLSLTTFVSVELLETVLKLSWGILTHAYGGVASQIPHPLPLRPSPYDGTLFHCTR